MPKSLLLEIGMEEVPARYVRGAAEQLRQKLETWLAEARISCGEVRAYATPRRIAVLAADVAERQADYSEEVKGPARKIAVDENGNWTKAALGFARSQGVAESELFFRELSGVEYVFARKSGAGQDTSALLPQSLSEIVQSMTFPKNMRWGTQELRFVRPIRWITALFGGDVVPLEIAGVKSGRISKGHRFLGGDVEIANAEEYVARLREQLVIVDIEERQAMIRRQIDELAADKGWNIAVPDDLLEEVLFLVEYPTVLHGSFDPAFLGIPQEVLITSMREHQRYFPVLNEAGQLQPYFVTVRNGDDRSLALVARGNEKVLKARLSDAKFFYEEDQKLQIDTALGRLETIVFHEELGTIGDKVRRIEKLTAKLAEMAELDPDAKALAGRAAHICKFDLVTQMVYEFPELQGIMGEDYARKLGEPEAVAVAVGEHYKPRFAGDEAPRSSIGAIVSIADKIDTIAGCFSIGIVPTGSQDPYALRRQAAGIVQILLEHRFPIGLSDLFREALAAHAAFKPLKRSAEETMADLQEFFLLRVRHVLNDKVRYDIADACLAAGIGRIPDLVRKAAALAEFVAGAEAKEAIDAWNRVCNLAAKAESDRINTELFEQQVEWDLYNKSKSVHTIYKEKMSRGDERAALQALAELKGDINRYFDAVMVMTDNAELRHTRLALLAHVAEPIRDFADFSKVVWQS